MVCNVYVMIKVSKNKPLCKNYTQAETNKLNPHKHVGYMFGIKYQFTTY